MTAKQVTIGATVPLTGIASSGYSEVAKAANAVFQWVNKKGGVNGRTIKFVLKDDCYGTPGFGCTGNPNTVAQTKALLSIPVFATVGSLGTPTQDSVRSLLKANKVPQLFVNSGSKDWNAPKKYPGLFGWQTSYTVESKIMGQYLKKHFAGQSVCFLGQHDDFGANGLLGLTDVGIKPIDTVMYDVAGLVTGGSGYFTPFISKFQADGCKIVVMDTIPGATDAALGNALALGYTPQWVISSVGADPVTVGEPFVGKPFPDPEIGAISFSYLPASTANNKWNPWMYKVMENDKTDFPNFTATTPLDGNMAYGIGWGVAFVEALKAAGRNVTRTSFLKTLTSTTFQTPALVPLRYTATNHQGLNGGYIVQVKSGTQTAVLDSTVYTTGPTKKSKIVKTKLLSRAVPNWLK
ncbi:MAG TPA: ABC transporter substrate-binding protein [Acidimicrobiales bacterium]|nr:ABC transporter substrate-binding protein [Acidimicrobiales bacterium]